MAADVLIGYSQVPLLISGVFGLVLCIVALIWGLAIGINVMRGQPASTVGVTLAGLTGIGGLLLLNLGIVGAYLGRAATEAKERPMYFIAADTGVAGVRALRKE